MSIAYRATTDRPTIANLTNHTYFNLGGEDADNSVLEHVFTIPAEMYTPGDAWLIPTGELRNVTGTVFDFRQSKGIGHDIRDGREPQLSFGKAMTIMGS